MPGPGLSAETEVIETWFLLQGPVDQNMNKVVVIIPEESKRLAFSE